MKFVAAAAMLVAAVSSYFAFAYSALAAVPSATPSIANNNATIINRVPVANVPLTGANPDEVVV